MKIQITVRHAEVPEALRAYASESLSSVERLGSEFERAEIVLDQGREGLVCEILLHARHGGNPLVARESSHDQRAAVDAAVAKIETQVARAKGRRDDSRRTGT